MAEKDNSHQANSEYGYDYHSSKTPLLQYSLFERATSILTRRVGGKYSTAFLANASTRKNDNDSAGGPVRHQNGKVLSPHFAAAASFSFMGSLRLIFGVTCVLYVMNQSHLLPTTISSAVSRVLFWPTLPITCLRRIGKWSTIVDDTVIIGGVPVPFFNAPERLFEDYNVRGVINMCEEYGGPMKEYNRLGIEQLHLPTIDHTEPSFEDIRIAVEFIADYEANDKGRVYVHCRAGHGRSAAIVYAWLLSKAPDISIVDMEELNKMLCKKRDVRKKLWKQSNINDFRSWLRFRNDKKDI